MSAMDSEMENNQNHVESTDKSPPITLRLRSLSTLLEKPPDGMKPITDRRTSEREKETSYLKTVLKRKLDQTNTANSICFVDVFESLMNKKVICLSSTCCQEENAKSANKFSSNASFFDTDIAILDYAVMEFENMDRGTKNHKNGPFRVDFKITNSPIVDDDFDLYDTKTDIPLNKLYVKGQTLEGSIPSIFGKFR